MGDQIPLLGTVGFALWVGVLALFFGGLAFALAPLLGRAGAAGISALAMILLWVANGLEVGGPLVAISPFHWMNAHIPLVGMYDWVGVLATGLLGVVFMVIGLELFNRRDLGVTSGIGLPTLPASVLGVHGPHQPCLRRPAAARARVGHRDWRSGARSSRRWSDRSQRLDRR